MNTQISRLKELHSKHSRYLPAAFFVLGFLFDVFTLGRIDDVFNIVQQVVYLGIISRLLYYRTLETSGLWEASGKWVKLWQYNVEILHFLLGSLLSAYTIFYFVSASLASSLVFMSLMFIILVANELPALQRQSLPLKMALFQICLLSFFSYFIPIVVQSVNVFTLIAACALSLTVAYTSFKALMKKGVSKDEALRIQLIPAAAIVGVILILYALKFLPPLPVSVQYMGVYHDVKKEGQDYVLSYDRSWFRFWQNGAQTFEAQPGDKLVLFARIFSPANMDDKVRFRWQQYIRDEWQTSDMVEIRVVGGRGEGFRAYSTKSNFDEGEWRVKIETLDGREMGRIGFDVEKAEASQERDFKTDRY